MTAAARYNPLLSYLLEYWNCDHVWWHLCRAGDVIACPACGMDNAA
jgi:hypothetical protein